MSGIARRIRRYLAYILLLAIFWELVGRQLVPLIWPDCRLPESALQELLSLLLNLGF